MPPGTDQRGQRRERAVRRRRAQVALRAHAQSQQGRLGAGEVERDALDLLSGHPGDLGTAVEREVVEPLEQLVEAGRVRAAPVLVDEPGIADRAHHPEAKRGVGARQRLHVLVREARGLAPVRVHDDEPRARAVCLEQQPP